jgi:hypothetical protein
MEQKMQLGIRPVALSRAWPSATPIPTALTIRLDASSLPASAANVASHIVHATKPAVAADATAEPASSSVRIEHLEDT